MNANPAPASSSAPQPRKPPGPRVIVSCVSRRDIIIGVLVGIAVIGFIVFAVFFSGGYKERNKLDGIVRGHNAPGLRETQMTMGLEKIARKPVTEKTIDTGYSLKVWVESEKREYEVMVSKEDWDKTKDGDTLSFMRPKSEQH